ncbi:MAG: hypothetical protein HQL51_11140 [Magnetococcales bacterium]|nr:hypothetical protein [Magnetococcales bacterium]
MPKPLHWFGKMGALLGLSGGLLVGCVSTPTSPIPPNAEAASKMSELLAALDDQAPTWKIGDHWEYSDGYTLDVDELSPDGLTRFQRKGASEGWIKRKGLFKVQEHDGDSLRQVVFNSRNPESLFPLRVGNRVTYIREYMKEQTQLRHETIWTVEGLDILETPAGKFDCWVLTMSTRSLDSNWTGYEKWWYSPEARHYVRMEYQYGNVPPSSRVLMRYHVAP